MILFDSHTHLTDDMYGGKQNEIVDNARKNNVCYMTDIGYNKPTSVLAAENSEKFEGVYATCGLHPENVNEYEGNFDFIYKLAREKKVVAIGEIGLDYHYEDHNKKLQKELFVEQINIANEFDLPVVIHSRDADMDMLEILKQNKIKNKFVMHCFSSSVEILKEMLKLDAYISIAGPVTFKNAKSLLEVVKLIPKDRIMIETDAPYLAPEPFRGKRNEPALVIHTAKRVAELRNVTLDEMAEITTENAKRFYNIQK